MANGRDGLNSLLTENTMDKATVPHTRGFSLLRRDRRTSARAGIIHTPHGDIPTPAFAPVGTQATVKSLSPRELQELGVSIVMVNTYHLYLRPGAEVVARLGGLHRFMGWEGPLITDSGGFQIFSLETLRRVNEDGAAFRSHIDGSEHFFTPEKSIQVQELLGADIIIALDECPEPLDYEYNKQALERTHRWAERCLAAHTRRDQALWGVIQGGVFEDLRRRSARFIAGLGFPGFAIGGLSVGEPKEMMHRMLEVVVPLLPEDKPRHLLGVGAPEDLFECVALGMDFFDCVLPTRLARNGALFVSTGRINIRRSEFAEDPSPIEEGCTCYTCQHFSRAYLRHLFKAEELLAYRLATIHNLHFILNLMRRIRESILQGKFSEFKEQFLAQYQPTDEELRLHNLRRRRARSKASS